MSLHESIKIEKFINNIVYPILIIIAWFFVMQPYMSPLPTTSDLQLFSLLFPLGFLGLVMIQKHKIQKSFFWFMPAAIVIEIFHSVVYGRPAGIYLATYIFIFFMFTFNKYLTSRYLWFLMMFHCSALVWQTIEPSSFNFLALNFVRDIKYTIDGARGATGFSAEPSFAAILATAYSIIYFRFYSENVRLRVRILFLILYFLAMFLTKSATGLIFLPVVLWSFWARNYSLNLRHYRTLIIFIICFLVLIKTIDSIGLIDGRGMSLVILLIENPSLFFLDGSLQERFRSLYVGYSALQNNLFGYGHGNFKEAYSVVASQNNLSFLFPNTRDIAASASGMGSIMAGTGILGTVFYFLIFLTFARDISLSFFPYFIFCLLMVFFSFSPAFPIIYLPLVLEKVRATTDNC